MHIVTTGLIVSATLVVALVALFRYEAKHGVRIGERVRTHADFFVLKTTYHLHQYLRFLGRDFIRQVFHYGFHTILRFVLSVMKRCEQGIRNMIRVNKTLAQKAERETTTLSKLEELALHKVEIALSDEEKRVHKEKMLHGQ